MKSVIQEVLKRILFKKKHDVLRLQWEKAILEKKLQELKKNV